MGSDDLFKKGKLRARRALQRKKELRFGRENIMIVCEGETEKLSRTYRDNTQPADCNPSTKVHLLVQELNKYL